MAELITSFQNSKVKLVKSLRDKKDREMERLFVTDDGRDLQRALICGYRAEFALVCRSLISPDEEDLLNRLDAPQYEISRDVLDKVAYRQNPSAIVTVFQQMPMPDINTLQDDNVTVVLTLVGLTKPGNIGALLRTADAARIEAIFLVDVALDIYNPNIIRSSTGTCFLRNIYTFNSEEAIKWLRNRRYAIVAAYVDGDSSLYEMDFTQKTAMVFGSEDKGLDATWSSVCDYQVHIPMMGKLTDSLNVSVSGAVFMYEAMRQRHYLSSQ